MFPLFQLMSLTHNVDSSRFTRLHRRQNVRDVLSAGCHDDFHDTHGPWCG